MNEKINHKLSSFFIFVFHDFCWRYSCYENNSATNANKSVTLFSLWFSFYSANLSKFSTLHLVNSLPLILSQQLLLLLPLPLFLLQPQFYPHRGAATPCIPLLLLYHLASRNSVCHVVGGRGRGLRKLPPPCLWKAARLSDQRPWKSWNNRINKVYINLHIKLFIYLFIYLYLFIYVSIYPLVHE